MNLTYLAFAAGIVVAMVLVYALLAWLLGSRGPDAPDVEAPASRPPNESA